MWGQETRYLNCGIWSGEWRNHCGFRQFGDLLIDTIHRSAMDNQFPIGQAQHPVFRDARAGVKPCFGCQIVRKGCVCGFDAQVKVDRDRIALQIGARTTDRPFN